MEYLRLLIESQHTIDQAKKLGLTYLRFGRYGKNGKVTHIVKGDDLVPYHEPNGETDQDPKLRQVPNAASTPTKINPVVGTKGKDEPSQGAASADTKSSGRNTDDDGNKMGADTSSQRDDPNGWKPPINIMIQAWKAVLQLDGKFQNMENIKQFCHARAVKLEDGTDWNQTNNDHERAKVKGQIQMLRMMMWLIDEYKHEINM